MNYKQDTVEEYIQYWVTPQVLPDMAKEMICEYPLPRYSPMSASIIQGSTLTTRFLRGIRILR